MILPPPPTNVTGSAAVAPQHLQLDDSDDDLPPPPQARVTIPPQTAAAGGDSDDELLPGSTAGAAVSGGAPRASKARGPGGATVEKISGTCEVDLSTETLSAPIVSRLQTLYRMEQEWLRKLDSLWSRQENLCTSKGQISNKELWDSLKRDKQFFTSQLVRAQNTIMTLTAATGQNMHSSKSATSSVHGNAVTTKPPGSSTFNNETNNRRQQDMLEESPSFPTSDARSLPHASIYQLKRGEEKQEIRWFGELFAFRIETEGFLFMNEQKSSIFSRGPQRSEKQSLKRWSYSPGPVEAGRPPVSPVCQRIWKRALAA